MGSLIISLDFELYWGVADSRKLNAYKNNIEGVWDAIPKLLKLFERHQVRVTWATVGMLMCRDFSQWCEIRPNEMPEYFNKNISNYNLHAELIKNNEKCFFAPELLKRILDYDSHEIASHTYSHFYCSEFGATDQAFIADMKCAVELAKDFNIGFKSFVFPRNQVNDNALKELRHMGFSVFRGNQNHWLYRDGHDVPWGSAGRAARLLDAYLPISGKPPININNESGMINCCASMFLRPWSKTLSGLDAVRLRRIKYAMLHAAKLNEHFHLWWHPHNFGINLERNLSFLNEVLNFYQELRDEYGMQSIHMCDYSPGLIS